MKLWLVRHAKPLIRQGVCYGALDVPADPDDTARAAAALAQILPPGLKLVSSPALRCQQLADALRQTRADLFFSNDSRIAEMDFGSWEGRSWQEIGQDALEDWTNDFSRHRCGGGESVSAFMARVQASCTDTQMRGHDAVWVTHAGVAKAISLIAKGQTRVSSAEDWPVRSLGYGQVLCVALPSLRT